MKLHTLSCGSLFLSTERVVSLRTLCIMTYYIYSGASDETRQLVANSHGRRITEELRCANFTLRTNFIFCDIDLHFKFSKAGNVCSFVGMRRWTGIEGVTRIRKKFPSSRRDSNPQSPLSPARCFGQLNYWVRLTLPKTNVESPSTIVFPHLSTPRWNCTHCPVEVYFCQLREWSPYAH